MIELVGVRQGRRHLLVEVHERQRRIYIDRLQQRIQQDRVVLAVTVAIPQCLAARLGDVSTTPELDGFVVDLVLHVSTQDLDTPRLAVDALDQPSRPVGHPVDIKFFLDFREVFLARLLPTVTYGT